VFLAKRYERGDQAAKHELMRCNYKLVTSIAVKFVGETFSLQEAIQIGHIGLMRATELFDYRKGFKFSTYATWWIRQALTREFHNSSRAIRVPVNASVFIRKCRDAISEYESEFGERPTTATLAVALEATEAEVADAVMLLDRRMVSLDMKVGEGGETELGELIAPSDDDTAEEAVTRVQAELLTAALNGLTDEARAVMEARYVEGKSLAETAQLTGLAQPEVRKIEHDALATLRGKVGR
jgi:RNA polymerase primary sigma factor